MAKQQTIIRSKYDSDFLTISNKLAQDRSLSYEARGLLFDLLSRPSDWEANIQALQIKGMAGREKVRRIIKELIKAGYIKDHEERRTDEGKIYYTPYIVSDKPFTRKPSTDNPSTGEPLTGKPSTANRLQQNTEVQSTEIQKTKELISSDDDADAVPDNTVTDEVLNDDAPEPETPATQPVQETEPEPTMEQWLDGIKQALPGVVPSARMHIWNMIRGTSKTGVYAENNLTPPVTHAELIRFGKWNADNYQDSIPISKPETIKGRFELFRENPDGMPGNQQATNNAPDYHKPIDLDDEIPPTYAAPSKELLGMLNTLMSINHLIGEEDQAS